MTVVDIPIPELSVGRWGYIAAEVHPADLVRYGRLTGHETNGDLQISFGDVVLWMPIRRLGEILFSQWDGVEIADAA